MPVLKRRVPRLCCHKASGRAVVYLNGRAVYLGRYGSNEATIAYHRLIALAVSGEAPARPTVAAAPTAVTINEAVLQFWQWCLERYRSPLGDLTGEHYNFRDAIRALRARFGTLPVPEFSPNKLRLLQAELGQSGIARTTVNHRIRRIRQFFSWCVSRELCPASVRDALSHVPGLRAGHGGRETAPKRPVAWERVEATLPFLSPMLQAMTKLYWLTGARLGELTALTLNEIDRSGDVWRAHITRHKNSWRGQERTLLFGVESIALLTPWLRLHEPDSPIFSPRVVAPNSGRRGRRAPTKQYTKAALARAIRRACDRAFPHPELSKLRRKSLTASQKGELRDWRIAHRWTIGQIRHAAATRFREQHGIEVAQAILGHSKPDMTAHYSREAVARAIEAVRVAG